MSETAGLASTRTRPASPVSTPGARDCTVGDGEAGSGFLNTVTVSGEGLTSATAQACVEIPWTRPCRPGSSSALPLSVLALGFVVTGAGLFWAARRRSVR